jgi:hypothetical protein
MEELLPETHYVCKPRTGHYITCKPIVGLTN